MDIAFSSAGVVLYLSSKVLLYLEMLCAGSLLMSVISLLKSWMTKDELHPLHMVLGKYEFKLCKKTGKQA